MEQRSRRRKGFRPIILEPSDLKQLRFPEISFDGQATQRKLSEADELFGDIVDVKLKGISHTSFHCMARYTALRGLEQVIMDMVLNPQVLHDAMSFYEEGCRGLVRQYIALNLLSLSNDATYHSSRGVGYTNELPKPDCDPARIRPCDMWASAEAQEMAQVSPRDA